MSLSGDETGRIEPFLSGVPKAPLAFLRIIGGGDIDGPPPDPGAVSTSLRPLRCRSVECWSARG